MGLEISLNLFGRDRYAEVFDTLDVSQLEGLADDIYSAYEQGRFVFLIGNGGSGSNCSHFCEDLGKSTLDRKDFTNDSVKRLKVPMERVMVNVDRYGNTGAASVYVALEEAWATDRVKPNDLILLAAFGGGFTWGAALLRW